MEAVVAVDSEETGDTTIRQQRSRVLNKVHCSSRFDTVRRRWLNYKYRQEVGVCWQCGGKGHIKRNCTKKKPAWRGPRNELDTTTVPESTKVQKPSVVVQGRVDG